MDGKRRLTGIWQEAGRALAGRDVVVEIGRTPRGTLGTYAPGMVTDLGRITLSNALYSGERLPVFLHETAHARLDHEVLKARRLFPASGVIRDPAMEGRARALATAWMKAADALVGAYALPETKLSALADLQRKVEAAAFAERLRPAIKAAVRAARAALDPTGYVTKGGGPVRALRRAKALGAGEIDLERFSPEVRAFIRSQLQERSEYCSVGNRCNVSG